MLLVALLLAIAASPTVSPAPAPDDIYRAALRRLAALPQPAYIDVTERRLFIAETPNGNAPGAFDQRVLFNSASRRETVLALPYSDNSQVLFSPSYFAPDNWLIHHPSQPQSTSPKAQSFTPDLSDLKTIASVVSVAKPSYDITLAGINKLPDGGIAYHLVLKPRSDPVIHNLRELWVKASDFDILRAVIDGTYAPDPNSPVEPSTVTEDFGQVGPYWVVVHHRWTYSDLPDHIVVHFDSTDHKMSFPQNIPDWYFDEVQFGKHRSQVNVTTNWPQR
ncbi:MAG TPA: hypothetical protein VKT72_01200 [Candidatus Baltobacteraceae bacterium]|nr:hypothetical protein [Candidatus Baltobacteraceae bacterium]